MKEQEIYWLVVWVNRADEYEKVEALCGSEEEALEVKKALTKERRYNDSFDYYRLDNDWDYEVRRVTGAELDAVRQQYIEKRLDEVHKSFWQHMEGEDFVEACRQSVAWVTEVKDHITDESILQFAKDGESFYAPWRDFHGYLKLFAVRRYTPPHWLSVWALVAGNSMGGSLPVPVRHFSSAAEFHQWASHEEEALAEFMSKLRERRLSRSEICELCERRHLNVCKHGGVCSSVPEE